MLAALPGTLARFDQYNRGDWGLGTWDWERPPYAAPQSPIPNPYSPLPSTTGSMPSSSHAARRAAT